MRTSTVAIWVVSALAGAHVALAQPTPNAQNAPTPSTQGSPTQGVTVSEAELETFATIYVDLLGTAAKFEEEMKAAQTEEQALEIKGRIETESIAKVAQRGWTPEKFNRISAAINSDPALADRAVQLIEEKS
jgi:hypothetical protein